MILSGCYTALVTPFHDGAVCHSTLAKLVESQIAGGVDGIVPVGTTGESPTLSVAEHEAVIATVVETVAGRCQVIAGTGGNSTAEALELTQHAKSVGADATLQVTPYYNKPSQEGLYRHFATIADVGLPVVLYNVPGRSAIPIDVATVARLSAHPHVVAVKEAGGSVDRVSQIRQECDICVLSGDDPLTLPMMVLGAKGVISVASNIVPAAVTQLTHLALAGDFIGAAEIHFRYYDLFRTMFIDTNPVPVKAAAAALGMVEASYRLPICAMDDQKLQEMLTVMRAVDLPV
ncbi:MAG: 4-hydroxy-tetrahydrodipicolinate synthase [Rhodothermales bacterium]|jgi:4-hydroxy-tetrahydrodipicolinate synthase